MIIDHYTRNDKRKYTNKRKYSKRSKIYSSQRRRHSKWRSKKHSKDGFVEMKKIIFNEDVGCYLWRSLPLKIHAAVTTTRRARRRSGTTNKTLKKWEKECRSISEAPTTLIPFDSSSWLSNDLLWSAVIILRSSNS